MKTRIFWPLALCAAACAASGDKSDSVTVQQAIQGGSVEAAEPAVGLLEFASGNFGTGTLISPRVVLTAGHVAGGNIQGFYMGPGKPIGRGVNTSASDTMRKIPITEKRIHPSYECKVDCDQWKGWNQDVSIIVLATPVTDVAPARFGTGAPQKGTICTTVGYGDHVADWDASDAQPTVKEKRTATSTVSTVLTRTFETTWLTGIPDSGDSGGPVFCDDQGQRSLLGTVAYHTDGDGPQHTREWYMRIDVIMPWIEEQLKSLGEPWPPPQNAAPVSTEDAGSGTPDAAALADAGHSNTTPATPGESSGCTSAGRTRDAEPVSSLLATCLCALALVRRRWAK